MKVTQTLCRQNIGYYLTKKWIFHGKKRIVDVNADKVLLEKGIPIFKPEDILQTKKQLSKFEPLGFSPKPIALDGTHPDWHDRTCYTYKDNNVLLEGLNQAKIITNTVEIQDGLPTNYALKNVSKEWHSKLKNIVMSSHVFDAEQKKLPKLKDPARPAWNFPRVYGITESRVNKLLTSKLIQLVEIMSDPRITKQRNIISDLLFSYHFERNGNLIQFQLKIDTAITTSKPLLPVTREDTTNFNLPDIFPVDDIITLNLENIYRISDIYPINMNLSKCHPHTIFIHYNKTEVKNIFEEEVTEAQIFGRSLLKTFTVAAAYAKQQFGHQVKLLPDPVVVQCVQTDGRLFHFGVLQLNTLDLDGGIKNVWYQTAQIPLFEKCLYEAGKPVLDSYNGDVMKYLLSFYNNS